MIKWLNVNEDINGQWRQMQIDGKSSNGQPGQVS
jgi:hypothetical protein